MGLTGALRDMYNPTCYVNPGKVSDAQYGCGTADGGGVHQHSGVPNHAYALIVDGGTYNGQTITGIGLTKAAHIYFRAESVYQNPATDFADHADAIEQSAADLVDVNLADLVTGAPSGRIITAADLTQIHKAMLAVEMLIPPTQSGFQPLLAQNPPACTTVRRRRSSRTTSTAATPGWPTGPSATRGRRTSPSATGRSSAICRMVGRVGALRTDPNRHLRSGRRREFGPHADTKQITIPASVAAPRLTFVHWVATEAGFDGGNVKIRCERGAMDDHSDGEFHLQRLQRDVAAAPATPTRSPDSPPSRAPTAEAVDGTWVGRSSI